MTTKVETQALDALMETEWEAAGCTVYSESVDEPLFTTFIDPDDTKSPTDLDIELAKRLAAFPNLLAALKAIVAALEQPVQYSGLRMAESSDILRADAAAAANIARAAIERAEGGAK